MGIDTSIYSNLLRPPKSVAEYDQEAMEGQQNRLMLQMNRAKMAEQERGIERGNRLTSMLGGFKPGMSAADQGDQLTRGGFIDEGRKVIESGAKANADQRAAEKAEIESHFKKFELAGQIMGGVKDQATWDRARQQTAQFFGPDAAAQMPAQYDPELVEQKRMQGMGAKDQLEQVWEQKGYDLDVSKAAETVRNNKAQDATSRANNANNNAVTMRGQNMIDARGREFNATAREEAKAKTAIGKAPTEFQGKSAAFGSRADQADKIISSLEGKYSPAAINAKQTAEDTWLVGGALGAVANRFALDDNDQRAEQAPRDFINAVLRQESGAAIGETEFANAKKQYFPQPGDKPAVLKQKSENRKLAVKGFKSNAGRAQFDTDAPAPSAAPALPAGWSVEVK